MEDSGKYVGRDDNGNILLSGTEYGDITIISYEIKPNGYEDLERMLDNQKIEVVLSKVCALEIDGCFSLKLNINNLTKQDHFILVEGGWIPCTFLKKNTLLLADRNVISRLQFIYSNGGKKKNKELDYLDSIFLAPMDMTIDISMFAIEANEKKIPTAAVIDGQLEFARNLMQLALPHVEIAEYPTKDRYYHDLAGVLSKDVEKIMNYLVAIAPDINKEFTSNNLNKAVIKIFEKAKDLELPFNSLAVSLALLRVVMRGKKTSATEVIKESQSYTMEDAYNTACDLMAIEVLANMIDIHKKNKSNYNVGFITKDKGLAKIGSLYLNGNTISTNGTRKTLSCNLPMSIFRDEMEARELVESYLN